MKRIELVKILMYDIDDTFGMDLEKRAEFILSSMIARGAEIEFEPDPEYEKGRIEILEKTLKDIQYEES